MSKIIDIASTGIRRSYRLANKTKQKYGLIFKFSLAVIGSGEVAKKPDIFLTRANQHIKEINRHLVGTLNCFDPMLFAAYQEQNEYFTFKKMCVCNYTSKIYSSHD